MISDSIFCTKREVTIALMPCRTTVRTQRASVTPTCSPIHSWVPSVPLLSVTHQLSGRESCRISEEAKKEQERLKEVLDYHSPLDEPSLKDLLTVETVDEEEDLAPLT